MRFVLLGPSVECSSIDIGHGMAAHHAAKVPSPWWRAACGRATPTISGNRGILVCSLEWLILATLTSYPSLRYFRMPNLGPAGGPRGRTAILPPGDPHHALLLPMLKATNWSASHNKPGLRSRL
jgi:hypothetical protein